jgi:hypothetical protein
MPILSISDWPEVPYLKAAGPFRPIAVSATFFDTGRSTERVIPTSHLHARMIPDCQPFICRFHYYWPASSEDSDWLFAPVVFLIILFRFDEIRGYSF